MVYFPYIMGWGGKFPADCPCRQEAEQHPTDFYAAGMDRAGIAGRIAESTEQAVNAALSFPPDAPDDALLSAVETFHRWNTEANRKGDDTNG